MTDWDGICNIPPLIEKKLLGPIINETLIAWCNMEPNTQPLLQHIPKSIVTKFAILSITKFYIFLYSFFRHKIKKKQYSKC